MYTTYEIFIFIFIALSFFFSAAETSIISANRIKLKSLAERGNLKAKRALYIIRHMEDAVGMILIGNNVVNTASAAFITFIAAKIIILDDSSLFVITTIQTVFFLIFCEVLPKTIARSRADSYLMFSSYLIISLMFILKPLIKASLFMTHGLKKLLRSNITDNSIIRSREEMSIMFQLGEREGIIDKNHQLFIDEILSMHEITAFEVMTPTIDITSIEKREGIKRLVSLISKTRFSRIPVYDGRVDNIIGYVFYRDLFLKRRVKKTEEILHEPYYIPTTKKIDDLFHDMQENEIQIAFVVNEYGAVVGLVTIEDIVEEVVGEIQTRDHHNHDLIKKINRRRYVIRGDIDIDYFQRRFGLNIEKKGFETLSGFMNYKFGRIPANGDRTKVDGHTLIAFETTPKSIESVILILPKK